MTPDLSLLWIFTNNHTHAVIKYVLDTKGSTKHLNMPPVVEQGKLDGFYILQDNTAKIK